MPTILVVDDDPAVVTTLQKTLESEGYAVLAATDGAQALRIVNRTPPDLVLLDLKMPGVSGVGFLKQIAGPDGKSRFPGQRRPPDPRSMKYPPTVNPINPEPS
jgi:CheY-like chemotaxis protein